GKDWVVAPLPGRENSAGRGNKGQGQRKGVSLLFEGGQTPMTIKYPKFGRPAGRTRKEKPTALNLGRIQEWIDSGRLNPEEEINMRHLYVSGCIHNLRKGGVKLLGSDATKLKGKINIVVSRASQTAIKHIESLGGSVKCEYHTPLSLRALVKPHTFERKGRLIPGRPMPVRRKDVLFLFQDTSRMSGRR
ncbi:hypothetical protein BT69DRAFT_1361786, partial [Atractiella rhizophila]